MATKSNRVAAQGHARSYMRSSHICGNYMTNVTVLAANTDRAVIIDMIDTVADRMSKCF